MLKPCSSCQICMHMFLRHLLRPEQVVSHLMMMMMMMTTKSTCVSSRLPWGSCRNRFLSLANVARRHWLKGERM